MLNPWVLDYDVGAWPILNALLYIYGVQALAFVAAAYMFARQGGRDWIVLVLEVGALAFATYLVTMEIRHWSGGSRTDGPPDGLTELALHGNAWLAIALAIYARAPLLENPVLRWGWRVLAAMGALFTAFAVFVNPLLVATPVGSWPVVNVLGLAYLVPAILAGGFAALADARGSRRFAAIAGGAALALGFVYVSLEVARAFRGARMHVADVTDGEMYAYSAVWLLYGVGLLVLGLWRGQKAPLRGARRGRADDPQGLPDRHGHADRRAAGVVLPRPGAFAPRPRLGLPALRARARAQAARSQHGLTA